MMIEASPNTIEMSTDDALALDYALGILFEPDLGLARRRLGGDAAFALLVSEYCALLRPGQWGDGDAGPAPATPRFGTWEAILARITGQQLC